MEIDTAKVILAISDRLKETLQRDESNGVLLGLSGGLDSAVLATIVVKALGPDKVKVFYLGDLDSNPEIAARAREMAAWLKLDLKFRPITKLVAQTNTYKSPIVWLMRQSSIVVTILQGVYRVLGGGERPLKSTLRIGAGQKLTPWLRRFLYTTALDAVEQGFVERHVFRRKILETIADKQNLSLIGGANRSEVEVGWFVKGGVDDVPNQPMTGLLKTQVRQLAKDLGLPAAVRTQIPSPDMANGLTDESAIWHQYAKIDLVMDYLDQGLDKDQIVARGIAKAELADIVEIMALSEWKRQSAALVPPITGRFGEAARVA